MKALAKPFLILGGTVSVALGVAGMFLPLLPTTPFLLLAAFCYARSSRRYYDWLMTNRWFGEYIRNYREGRGIPLRQKAGVITLLWLTIGYATLFVVPLWWARVLLLGIATAVTVHLLRLPTHRREESGRGTAGEHQPKDKRHCSKEMDCRGGD